MNVPADTGYFALGFEHFLSGADHVLFVLGLFFLVSGWRRLFATFAAFAIAQSLTLAAAVLGWVHVPQAPLEAAIALSIVFLAVEIIHDRQGRRGFAARKPWVVAFGCGLLHGLGFAGALHEVGLPETAVQGALLFFNLGIMASEVAFVLAVGFAIWAPRSIRIHWLRWCETLSVYALGTLAMYWTIDRTILITAG